MKDYASMSDQQINREVQKLTGIGCMVGSGVLIIPNGMWRKFDPCNNPADAWPIIADSSISLIKCGDSWLAAEKGYGYDGIIGGDDFCGYGSGVGIEGKNPLRCAMIVFLMMKEKE